MHSSYRVTQPGVEVVTAEALEIFLVCFKMPHLSATSIRVYVKTRTTLWVNVFYDVLCGNFHFINCFHCFVFVSAQQACHPS